MRYLRVRMIPEECYPLLENFEICAFEEGGRAKLKMIHTKSGKERKFNCVHSVTNIPIEDFEEWKDDPDLQEKTLENLRMVTNQSELSCDTRMFGARSYAEGISEMFTYSNPIDVFQALIDTDLQTIVTDYPLNSSIASFIAKHEKQYEEQYIEFLDSTLRDNFGDLLCDQIWVSLEKFYEDNFAGKISFVKMGCEEGKMVFLDKYILEGEIVSDQPKITIESDKETSEFFQITGDPMEYITLFVDKYSAIGDDKIIETLLEDSDPTSAKIAKHFAKTDTAMQREYLQYIINNYKDQNLDYMCKEIREILIDLNKGDQFTGDLNFIKLGCDENKIVFLDKYILEEETVLERPTIKFRGKNKTERFAFTVEPIQYIASFKNKFSEIEESEAIASLLNDSNPMSTKIAKYLAKIDTTVQNDYIHYLRTNFIYDDGNYMCEEIMDELRDIYSTYVKAKEVLKHNFQCIPKEVCKEDIQNYSDLELCVNSFPLEVRTINLSKEKGDLTKKLGSLPENMGNLQNLTTLSINGNNIRKIPDSIGELSLIDHLSIARNQLTELPESIGNLHSLESLFIGNNNIEELPESIGNLKSLKLLWLNHNNLKKLPKSIGNLESLVFLDLESNFIKDFPRELLNIPELSYIKLNENLLNKLPEDIDKLKQLNVLLLNKNNLFELPENIGKISDLRNISVENNNIIELPKSIGNLQSLEQIHVQENQLSELPESIGNLVNLKDLRIENNNIIELPESFLKSENEAIQKAVQEFEPQK
jgi:Leucine-rich repeat (LRR) protein